MSYFTVETPAGERSMLPVGLRLGAALGEAAMAGMSYAVAYAPGHNHALSISHPNSAEFKAGAALLALEALRELRVAIRDSRVDAQNEILEPEQEYDSTLAGETE